MSANGCGSEVPDPDPSPAPEQPAPRERSGPAIEIDARRVTRTEAPPAGVAEQLSWFGSGDGSCELNTTGRPRITFIRKYFAYSERYDPAKNDEPVIGEELYVCFPGFEDALPVDVSVRAPDGSTRRLRARRLTPDSPLFLALQVLPGDQLGHHIVTARQGPRHASSSYTVGTPTASFARVVPRDGTPGADARRGPVRIVVIALKPRRRIELRLYRRHSTTGLFNFVSSIPIQVDANGEALVEIRNTAHGRRGSYIVVPSVRGLFSESSPLTFDLP
jgi:hypothetical protein